MKKSTYFLFLFQFFACQISETKKEQPLQPNFTNENVIIKKTNNPKENSENNCIISTENNNFCDIGTNRLFNKIQKIDVEKFSFVASPFIFNNKIAINKARPISFDVVDYESIPKYLNNKIYKQLQTPKASYILTQNERTIAVRSNIFINFKTGKQYLFNATNYKITTTNEEGNIIVIKKVIEINEF